MQTTDRFAIIAHGSLDGGARAYARQPHCTMAAPLCEVTSVTGRTTPYAIVVLLLPPLDHRLLSPTLVVSVTVERLRKSSPRLRTGTECYGERMVGTLTGLAIRIRARSERADASCDDRASSILNAPSHPVRSAAAIPHAPSIPLAKNAMSLPRSTYFLDDARHPDHRRCFPPLLGHFAFHSRREGCDSAMF